MSLALNHVDHGKLLQFSEAATVAAEYRLAAAGQPMRGLALQSTVRSLLVKVVEVAGKPGVMSAAGVRAERAMALALRTYFRSMTNTLRTRLSKLGSMTNAQVARHAAEIDATSVVRRYSETLLKIVTTHRMKAYKTAAKMEHMHEAANDTPKTTAQRAAEFAAEGAAEKIQGINETTIQRYADAVEQAIEDQIGVQGLSKLLRDISSDMTKVRADAIAAFEIADAFGEAAIAQLQDNGVEYKQLVTSPDACEICQSIEDAGPVPVDDSFVDEDGEEYDRPPIHVNCRCAVVGARNPDEAGDKQ